MDFGEQELLIMIKKGNIETYEKLYHQFQPRLYAFCRNIVSEQETARDIVQEVFLDFWQKRERIEITTNVKTYLFSMLHHRCMNFLRQIKIHNRYTSYTEIKLKEAELNFYDPEQDTYISIFFKEVQEVVNESINHLPDACRDIFVMSRIEGLGNKEIAEKLGLSVRTVENQIYRALKHLKLELKDYLPLLPLFFVNLLG